jgi:hypothetical protein
MAETISLRSISDGRETPPPIAAALRRKDRVCASMM